MTSTQAMSPPAGPAAQPELEQTYKKILLRLIPFLMVLWILAWIDRVNIGFVKLTMLDDLKWSEAIYGLGADPTMSSCSRSCSACSRPASTPASSCT